MGILSEETHRANHHGERDDVLDRPYGTRGPLDRVTDGIANSFPRFLNPVGLLTGLPPNDTEVAGVEPPSQVIDRAVQPGWIR